MRDTDISTGNQEGEEASNGYHTQPHHYASPRHGGIGQVLRQDLRPELRWPTGHFAPVWVNDTLTLDFDNADRFERHHYAFHVSDEEFDAILGRVKAEGIPYGSGLFDRANMQLNTRRGGRGFYFDDPDGHILELLTRT